MLDKQQVRRAFSKAASAYDQTAVLQQEIGRRLLDRLTYIRAQMHSILDLGAGTGEMTVKLQHQYPDARVVALDFAEPMLYQCRKRSLALSPLCADIEELPFKENSFDLIYSNAALQWITDLESCFSDLWRVLKPNGLLLFSTFGPDTLKELRAAWKQIDNYPHVSSFTDMHHIGDLLINAGFTDPVVDQEQITMTYADIYSLMRDIKSIGAQNQSQARMKGLTGKEKMFQLEMAYEAFRQDGRLPSTWEVIYGLAWVSQNKQRRIASGEAHISLNSLKSL